MIKETSRVYAQDFVLGVFNGAAEIRDPFVIDRYDYRVDNKLSLLSRELIELEDSEEVKVFFRLAPDEIHSDSKAVRDTLRYMEHGTGFLVPECPRNLVFDRAGRTMEEFHDRFRIPGSAALYLRFGRELVDYLDNQ